MKYSEKQILYQTFLNEWGSKFDRMPSILNYIASDPKLVARLEDFTPLKPAELYESQLEWIALLAQLTNPIDTVFFKPYWVPLDDQYDYFMDLSCETFPIFEFHYIFFEPYAWYKNYFFKDISTYFASSDDPNIDLDEELRVNKAETWLVVEEYLDEYDKLKKEGKVIGKPDKWKSNDPF